MQELPRFWRFMGSRSGRGFLLHLGVCAALSVAVGCGFYYFSLNWFQEHKSSEKITALQLVDAFVTNYSAVRSQFGKDAPVPASFRAHAIEAFNKQNGRGNVYRPYYADDFSIFYTGHFEPNTLDDNFDYVEDYLRGYLASYHVVQYLYNRLYWGSFREYSRPYSGYNDFTDVDLARLKRALEDIKSTADAHGARVAVFLIPRTMDFRRLHESHQDRLGPLMEQWGQANGIPIKDLLPEMDARAGADYKSYFLLCDNHWAPHGAAVAADVLLPWLGYGQSTEELASGLNRHTCSN